MNYPKLGAALVAAAVAGRPAQLARAEDQKLKIGVVATESGPLVSAGNTIVAAARRAPEQINDPGDII
jgi:ABC-type branched-subunit amino acid transport system substrate-binding protein